VALPGDYAPASIALRFIGARKPPPHDKAAMHIQDVITYVKYNTANNTTAAQLLVTYRAYIRHWTQKWE
jgi:hypothetical protein